MAEEQRLDDASERSDEESETDCNTELRILQEKLIKMAQKPGGISQEDAANGTQEIHRILKDEADRRVNKAMEKVSLQPGDTEEDVRRKVSTAKDEVQEIKSFFQMIIEAVGKMMQGIANAAAAAASAAAGAAAGVARAAAGIASAAAGAVETVVTKIKDMFIWLGSKLVSCIL